jgi:hypothetical protein
MIFKDKILIKKSEGEMRIKKKPKEEQHKRIC